MFLKVVYLPTHMAHAPPAPPAKSCPYAYADYNLIRRLKEDNFVTTLVRNTLA